MSKTCICFARFLTAGEIFLPVFSNLAPLARAPLTKGARDGPRPLHVPVIELARTSAVVAFRLPR
jgi:hypothetical protein